MPDHNLERLYDAYASGLFHYLVTFTKNEADAKDLLQEVFIRLARGLKVDLQNEQAFFFRLAHNLSIDWLRRRKVRWDSEEQILRDQESGGGAVADPDAQRLAGALAEALKTLPDEQRTIAQLKLWDGLTFEQIAEIQNIPLNTAASRYRYALEKLRTLLLPLYKELK